MKKKYRIAFILTILAGCQNRERIIENDFDKVSHKSDKIENPLIGVWRQDSTGRFERNNIILRLDDGTFEGFSFRADKTVYVVTKHPNYVTDERLGTYEIKSDSIVVNNDKGISIVSFKYEIISEKNLLLEVEIRSEKNFMWLSKYEFRKGKYEKI